MQIVTEPLNGGIVQVRHPSLLRPGEIVDGDNLILKPNSTALHRAPGRTTYGTVRSVGITTVTHSTTSLTSAALFGTDYSTVQRTSGSPFITRASAMSGRAGDYVVGTGIPAGSFIKSISADLLTIELTQNCTSTTTSGTVTVADGNHLKPGMYITGNGIPVNTTIVSITDASTLVMSAPATTNNISASRTFSSKISGLRALPFDHGNDDILLAKADDSVYFSPLTAETGSFTELESGLSQHAEAILQAIQYHNRYIYLTGYDQPRVLQYKDTGSGKTIQERQLGMLPVPDFVGVTEVDGSWSSLDVLGNGWYYFLVVEVAIYGDGDEVEGTFTGTPKAVQMTDYTTKSIQVTYSTAANLPINDGKYGRNTATHWRVYMSPKQPDEFPKPDLASFRRVAEVPMASNTIVLASENPYQTGYARSVVAYASDINLFPNGATNALSGQAAHTVTCTLSGNQLVATTGDFSLVTPGMVITSTNNYIPYGTTVQSVEDTTHLTMSNEAEQSASGEVIGFGNKSSFDGTYGVIPVNTDANRRGGVFQDFGVQNIGAFSSATITGIKVEILGRFVSAAEDTGFIIELNKGGSGGSFSTTGRVAAFQGGSVFRRLKPNIIELGGPFDPWGLTWSPTDLIDGSAKFGVLIRKVYGGDGEDWTHHIDGVRVTFYGGGNNINLEGEPFRTVIVSDQLGVSFGSPARGYPPIASTGAVFDGMLVLNDARDESVVCGSLAEEPEAFPDIYRIPIESEDNDKVRVIQRLADVLVVGCLNSVKRMNYFPKETDADFAPGRCYEDIATDHGMVGPRAAKRLELPGKGTVLAYLSHSGGLRATDGTSSFILNDDLDWDTLIDPDYIHRSVLEVYPRLFLVALYYVAPGQTRAVSCMYFSYHPIHVKQGGKLPACGPVSCEAGSAAAFLLNGQSFFATGHNIDGKVYFENSGTTNEDGTAILPRLQTRQIIPSEIGASAKVERLFIVTDADGDATTGGFSVGVYGQNSDENVKTLQSGISKNTATGGVIKLFPNFQTESFYFILDKASAETADLVIHYFGFDVTDYGYH